MNNSVPAIISSVEKNLPQNIFSSPGESKLFLRNLTSVYLNNPGLVKLDPQRVGACALQLFLRGADMESGEGFIIGYKNGRTGQTVASVQTGYKYAEKKLWETGELKNKPTVTVIKEGEVKSFDPHLQEAEIESVNLSDGKSFMEWKAKKTIGYLVTFEMVNEQVIKKFFWQEQIEEHCKKYSKSFGGSDGIWNTNAEDMFKKTAFMRAYTFYLPKSTKIKQAINDINALNFAAYDKLGNDAKPQYVDNPQEQLADNSAQEEPMFEQLLSGDKWKAWNAEAFKETKNKKEITKTINDLIEVLAKQGLMSNKDAKNVKNLTQKDYLEVLVPVLGKFKNMEEVKEFIADNSALEVIEAEVIEGENNEG